MQLLDSLALLINRKNLLTIFSIGTPPNSQRAQVIKRLTVVVWGALPIVAYVVLAGRNLLSTPLGPIDDHEYLVWKLSNPTGDLSLAIVEGLQRTVGEFNAPRYRPIFHPVRSISTALFGDDPRIRYLFRMLLAALGLILFSSIQRRLVQQTATQIRPIELALITATSVAAFEWQDVVARLGSQEIFALFGSFLALFALSASKSAHSGPLFFLGVVLMTGFKENFSFHALILTGAALMLNIHLKWRRLLYFTAVISLISCGLVGLALSSNAGTDYYGQERNIQSYLRDFFFGFVSTRIWIASCLILLLLLLAGREFRRHLFIISLAVFCSLQVEWIFYGDEMSHFGRYSSYSNLILVALLNMNLIFLLRRVQLRLGSHSQIITGIIAASVVLVSATVLAVSLGRDINHSNSAKDRATEWNEAIVDVTQAVNEAAYTQVLISLQLTDATFVKRWERARALPIFLRDDLAPEVRVFLSLESDSAKRTAQGTLDTVTASLSEISRSGEFTKLNGGDAIEWLAPLAEFETTTSTYCVRYSSSGTSFALEDHCSEVSRFLPNE